jgi:hypothetical protein
MRKIFLTTCLVLLCENFLECNKVKINGCKSVSTSCGAPRKRLIEDVSGKRDSKFLQMKKRLIKSGRMKENTRKMTEEV